MNVIGYEQYNSGFELNTSFVFVHGCKLYETTVEPRVHKKGKVSTTEILLHKHSAQSNMTRT